MLWVWENRSILLHFSGLSLLHIPCQWTNKLILSCHIHFNTPIIIFSPFTRICICHFYNVTVYSIMTDDLRERSYPTVYFHCKKFSKTSTHYEKLEKKYNTSRAICWFFFFLLRMCPIWHFCPNHFERLGRANSCNSKWLNCSSSLRWHSFRS